jgi:hypothetical protein
MDNRKTNNKLQAAPKAEKDAPSTYDSANLLEKIEKLDQLTEFIQKRVDHVISTNSFIILVLFIGFIALLFSLIGVGISVFRSDYSSQTELIRSVDQLNNNINNHLK